MKYLNLNIAKHLRSPQAIGSSPAEFGAWIRVLAFCAAKENGGRIIGGALWSDRQWQQLCAVSAADLRAADRLIQFDGNDVVVNGYALLGDQAGPPGRLRLSELRKQTTAPRQTREPNAPPIDAASAEALSRGIARYRP